MAGNCPQKLNDGLDLKIYTWEIYSDQPLLKTHCKHSGQLLQVLSLLPPLFFCLLFNLEKTGSVCCIQFFTQLIQSQATKEKLKKT